MTLIDQLVERKFLKTPQIIKAFQKIKREDFVLSSYKDQSENNAPLDIGFGQTISQPLTVAFMFELCQPKEGDKILDIGSGSGWTTALFAEIVGDGGKVYGIERIAELKEYGENNAEKYKLVSAGRAVFVCGDGSRGLPEYAPYNVIHVGAAVASIPPELLKQLTIGGHLVMPVGLDTQDMILIEKTGPDKYQEKKFPGFVFVPLITS